MAVHFLKVEIDVDGGSNYVEMSIQQLWSVPYALYAEKSGNDNDRDSLNEIQTLSYTGDSITLTDGGGINLNNVINQFIDTIQNKINNKAGFEYYNAAGTYPLNLAANITSFFIDIWGAAGSGAVSSSSTLSGGGGGGAGFFHGLININSGDLVEVILGNGGAGISAVGTGNNGNSTLVKVNGNTILTINGGTGGSFDSGGNPIPGTAGNVIVNNTSICKGVSVDGSDALLQNPGGASGPGFPSFNASRTPTIFGNGSAGRTSSGTSGAGQSGVVFIKW